MKELISRGIVIKPDRGVYALASWSKDGKDSCSRKNNLRFKRDLMIMKTVGVGSECVYIYFNPNDRKLARICLRNFFECKIGYSKYPDPTPRVLEQGITAMSRLPIIGLIIRTDNAFELETRLKLDLKNAGYAYEDRVGSEWFMMSPKVVESRWRSYSKSAPVANLSDNFSWFQILKGLIRNRRF
jgi:hypothetical protein